MPGVVIFTGVDDLYFDDILISNENTLVSFTYKSMPIFLAYDTFLTTCVLEIPAICPIP